MICEAWDVVVVPFPFTDRTGEKRRPALVVSRRPFNRRGHTVLAMITSAAHRPWPGDWEVRELDAAGLRAPCMARLKVFTLDNRLVIRRIGTLGEMDQRGVEARLRAHLA